MNMDFRDPDFYLGSEVQNALDKSGKLNLRALFRCIHRRGVLRPEEVEKIANILLTALLERDCKDGFSVLRFFVFYGRYLSLAWEYTSQRAGWVRRDVPDTKTRWVLKSMRPGFSRIEPEPELKKSEWIALNVGDHRYMSALVRYGYWRLAMACDDNLNREDYLELLTYMEAYRRRNLEPVPDSIKKIQETRGPWRLSFVARTLKAVCLYEENHPTAEDYYECLRVYFATVRCPAVSEDEVRSLATYLVSDDSPDLVLRIIDRWLRLFSQPAYCPRSLRHICRVTVRSQLAHRKDESTSTLLEAVRQLPLPRKVKDFVLGSPE